LIASIGQLAFDAAKSGTGNVALNGQTDGGLDAAGEAADLRGSQRRDHRI
jgi:hypothetical protein